MEKSKAISVMSALAQPTRLAAFSLLARAEAREMTAGDLAEKTGTPANTMSAHLLILSQAGLVKSRRSGKNIFYEGKPEEVIRLIAFLTNISGAGDPPTPE